MSFSLLTLKIRSTTPPLPPLPLVFLSASFLLPSLHRLPLLFQKNHQTKMTAKSQSHPHFLLNLTPQPPLYLFPFSYQKICNPQGSTLLLAFSHSLSSSLGPLNWSSNFDYCSSWKGIVCDNKDKVTHSWLPSRGLTGRILSSLTNLISLSKLNSFYNHLLGFLLNGIFSSLHSLDIIDVISNSLHCVVISQHFFPLIDSFRSIIRVIIDVSSNQIYRGIEPSWFFQGSNLSVLMRVTIASPDIFLQASAICITCPLLRKLDFSSNESGRQIYVGLGRCSKLKVFRVGYNFCLEYFLLTFIG